MRPCDIDYFSHCERRLGDEALDDAGGDACDAHGLAPIVAERELIEIGLQMLWANGTGMCADEPALQQ